jgi:hypothetical protein
MFYIYGARKSRATDQAENLLIVCQKQYKVFFLGEDYTINQLHRLIPNTKHVPHIYDGLIYVGGTKELYDYLYKVIKFDEENNK